MWQEEEIKQLYKAIFHRKSVRAFAPEPLDKQFLERLLSLSGQLAPALPEAAVAFRLLEPGQIKGGMANKARHFLALYAGPGEAATVNAAFMMQQLELWLSTQGVGCCWMGIPKPVAEMKRAGGLDYLIMLVFGKPEEALYREDVEEFPRKELSEITDTKGLEDILLPLRLAPSAINRQPWYVTAGEDCLRLHVKRDNMIMKQVLRNMPLVDMGIGLCHLWLAAEAQGRLAGLNREAGSIDSPPGYKYVWSINLK